MILLFIFIILIGLLSWLLISPIVIRVDTRIPKVELKWISVGKILLWYEDEWWLGFRLFFFRKKYRLSSLIASPKKSAEKSKKKKRKINRLGLLKKMVRLIKTFQVQEWQLSIDTGDYLSNAYLYPANFLPYGYGHVYINFSGENYFFIRIRNRPWKMIYAYLR